MSMQTRGRQKFEQLRRRSEPKTHIEQELSHTVTDSPEPVPMAAVRRKRTADVKKDHSARTEDRELQAQLVSIERSPTQGPAEGVVAYFRDLRLPHVVRMDMLRALLYPASDLATTKAKRLDAQNLLMAVQAALRPADLPARIRTPDDKSQMMEVLDLARRNTTAIKFNPLNGQAVETTIGRVLQGSLWASAKLPKDWKLVVDNWLFAAGLRQLCEGRRAASKSLTLGAVPSAPQPKPDDFTEAAFSVDDEQSDDFSELSEGSDQDFIDVDDPFPSASSELRFQPPGQQGFRYTAKDDKLGPEGGQRSFGRTDAINNVPTSDSRASQPGSRSSFRPPRPPPPPPPSPEPFVGPHFAHRHDGGHKDLINVALQSRTLNALGRARAASNFAQDGKSRLADVRFEDFMKSSPERSHHSADADDRLENEQEGPESMLDDDDREFWGGMELEGEE